MLAIFLGLSPFFAMEAGLQLASWQPQVDLSIDPFIEFHGTNPLFVCDTGGQHMKIADNRVPLFQRDTFSIAKDDHEFRVFVLGGSTVQCRPYSIDSSFTKWLELGLQSTDPQRTWKVVNCGGVSYASYRLVPILDEVLNYQPDLIILYTGHNEFLEARTYSSIKQVPTLLAPVVVSVAKLKSFQFVRQWLGGSTAANEHVGGKLSKTQLNAEVDALLDYQNGLEEYQRDLTWRAGVIQHFQLNLRRMIQMASDANVPVMLVKPAVNLKDCPPFKVASSEGLSSQALSRIEALWAQARSLGPDKSEQAVTYLKQALAIDGQHAGMHYHLAQCYLHLGKSRLAEEHFQRANDEDICPLRILSTMQQILGAVAKETQTPIVDVQQMFNQLSEDGIPGDRWFLDHVHPRITGHQMIANRLLDKLVECDLVTPGGGWEARRKQHYEDQFLSLDTVYFERGKQRLEGLRRWTKGRSRKTRGQ